MNNVLSSHSYAHNTAHPLPLTHHASNVHRAERPRAREGELRTARLSARALRSTSEGAPQAQAPGRRAQEEELYSN